MKKLIFVKFLLFLALIPCIVQAQNPPQTQTSLAQTMPVSDEAAIRKTAMDYIESWYDGDFERMKKCLHPDFAKLRALDSKKADVLNAEKMVQLTKGKLGMGSPKDKLQKDITILDQHGSMATVKVVSFEFVDYLSLAKVDGHWLIFTALWNFK